MLLQPRPLCRGGSSFVRLCKNLYKNDLDSAYPLTQNKIIEFEQFTELNRPTFGSSP